MCPANQHILGGIYCICKYIKIVILICTNISEYCCILDHIALVSRRDCELQEEEEDRPLIIIIRMNNELRAKVSGSAQRY